MSQDQVRSALNAMLTFFGMDEDEWNKHIFEQARKALAAQPARAGGDAPDVDELAQFIRAIDGAHTMGTGALAERIVGWLSERAALAAAPQQEEGGAITVEDSLRTRLRWSEEKVQDLERENRALRSKLPGQAERDAALMGLMDTATGAAPQPAAAEPAGGVVDELAKHLRAAHAFIENTDAFGRTASHGILDCGGCIWHVDESKAALARHESGAPAAPVEQPAASTVPAKKLTIAEIKGEYAQHEAQIGSWLTMWDRSGLSRSAAIRRLLQEMHRLHFDREDAAPAAVEREALDAARYRWLRFADLDALAKANWGDGEVYEGEEFDAAIDAARAGIGSSKEGGDGA